jgi:hypothetical protein
MSGEGDQVKRDHDLQTVKIRHSPEDSVFLKKYVRRRPNSKMAWYLLGREYEARGERGKAVYCYAQAGEVYEAFESEPISRLLAQWKVEPVPGWPKRDARRWKLRLAALAAVLMLFIAIVPAERPEHHAADGAGKTAGRSATQGGIAPTLPDAAAESAEKVYYLAQLYDRGGIGAALEDIALSGSRRGAYSVVVQPVFSEDGRWRYWPLKPKPLLEAERAGAADRLNVRYLDAESCSCEPGDAGRAERLLPAWQEAQEATAVLRSAIYAYALKYGALPDGIDRLVRPYPDNVLPGYTPLMAEYFSAMRESVAQELGDKAAIAGRARDDGPSGAADLLDPLRAPLEIWVDKETHRLALVSGTVILRSYPVGLGGDKTPEGEFTITEKVRNPNGRSDGEFGSRGMTLSDTLYAIHGTNQPSSIGEDRSLGCVRMLKEHIEELFDMVPIGTKVIIGKGFVPDAIATKERPFQVPLMTVEENPDKIYQWLN